MPRWFARMNKRVFNDREVAKGRRPVLTHVGRSSGVTHRTPLDAHPIVNGYLFILVYGSVSDWVRNVMASGSARLRIHDEEVELTNPRVVGDDEAYRLLPESAKRPAGFLNVSEYLLMDTSA